MNARQGDLVLNDARDFIARFCVFPDSHCLTAVTLWAAHTHIAEYLHTTPRLAIVSPEPGSGKTRVQEVLALLVHQPMLTVNASPAAIFRTLSIENITLLFDESDAIWSRKGKDDNHEDLRALINSGYKVGATIPRCVGPKHDVTRFKVFCPVSLSGIGDMPDTIMSRSVIIRMRRRAPHEHVEQFRSRQHDAVGFAIRDRLGEWSTANGKAIGNAWPEMPCGIVDRPAEVWEPLLAIADSAGGEWPELARNACISLCAVAEDRKVSLGVRLLADLRTVFGDTEVLYTSSILEMLTEGSNLEADAPWSDLRGKPISERKLASFLHRYDIRPTKVREYQGAAKQGYRRQAFCDAWQRYLPPAYPAQAEHPEHLHIGMIPSPPLWAAGVPDVPDVPDARGPGRAPWEPSHVPDVPDTRTPVRVAE